MTQYRIKNWADYQHYKDRCPPWIKLHHSLLTSEVWVMGTDASRVLAVACMLLASRNTANDGTFNGDPEYVKRFGYLNCKPDFKQLIQYGFIELVQDASVALAPCNTEERREEENREEKKPRKKSKTSIPDGFGISDSVREWANKNGYQKLEERLAHFVTISHAKGYEYADWDAAFRNAISGDWAKLGGASLPVGKFDVNEWLKSK